MTSSPTVLLIGASRGLGFALAQEWLSRGWKVIATVRSSETPLHRFSDDFGERLQIEQVDVNNPEEIEALTARLSDDTLDILYVNAGVALGPDDRVDQVSTEDFTRLMVTNALSPLRVVERLDSKVKESGTIAVMSSSLGSVTLNESGGWKFIEQARRPSTP